MEIFGAATQAFCSWQHYTCGTLPASAAGCIWQVSTDQLPVTRAACCMLQMRDTVRQVAHLFPTAIISGRGRDKVEAFVQLPELFYAGSHGMDIAGPRVSASSRLGEAAMQLLAFAGAGADGWPSTATSNSHWHTC